MWGQPKWRHPQNLKGGCNPGGHGERRSGTVAKEGAPGNVGPNATNHHNIPNTTSLFTYVLVDMAVRPSPSTLSTRLASMTYGGGEQWWGNGKGRGGRLMIIDYNGGRMEECNRRRESTKLKGSNPGRTKWGHYSYPISKPPQNTKPQLMTIQYSQTMKFFERCGHPSKAKTRP